ncbi:hypothetical protein DPMN_140557 [Dreissena polymorpha]|uniref:Uncharacterized protein n=1 Tax=Dreissena polymorpha TaxID=45954 RepID=A0A9D4JJ47_DREPO|nr:hypothetical protein DPMN_140557 [Dreissena polymorpha]
MYIEKTCGHSRSHIFGPIFIKSWPSCSYINIRKLHVIQLTGTIFELNSRIKESNVLTKFHEKISIKPMKTAPPTGGHIFQRTVTTFKINQHIIGHEIFELDRDFIGTKLLTKFHEDRTINVASRVFTNKCGRRTDRSQKLT